MMWVQDRYMLLLIFWTEIEVSYQIYMVKKFLDGFHMKYYFHIVPRTWTWIIWCEPNNFIMTPRTSRSGKENRQDFTGRCHVIFRFMVFQVVTAIWQTDLLSKYTLQSNSYDRKVMKDHIFWSLFSCQRKKILRKRKHYHAYSRNNIVWKSIAAFSKAAAFAKQVTNKDLTKLML